MAILAETPAAGLVADGVTGAGVDIVVGGDTHRDTHTLEIATVTAAPITTFTISNDAAGYAAACDRIRSYGDPDRVVVGLEGTRSYGIGLARALSTARFRVVEVERPSRAQRRAGKSDPIDAHLAVLSVLRAGGTGQWTQPRADGAREALRILLAARDGLATSRTAQINRLRALLLTGNDDDRRLARASMSATTLTTLIRRRARRDDTVDTAVRRIECRRLAQSIRDGATALKDNKEQLAALVTQLAPRLLEHIGVGPVSAAYTIVAWSHPGRCRDDAAFASLAGVNPIPASSGRTTRHRLNRGGDRRLNQAIHTIAVNRWRTDPRTHAYIARRRADGKTDREIRRSLKRYIAREIYKTLEHTT